MKKFLSIFIAMLIAVSLFAATTVVAFAEGEDTTTYTITYNLGEHGDGDAPQSSSHKAEATVTLVSPKSVGAEKGYEFTGWSDGTTTYALGDEFIMPASNVTLTAQWTTIHTINFTAESNAALMDKLNEDEGFANAKIEKADLKIGKALMDDVDAIREIFDGIKYVVSGDEKYDLLKDYNDKIYVEYCRSNESPKGQETWQNSISINDNISIKSYSAGWYLFRIVVKDFTGKNVLATSEKISRCVEDNKAPVFKLSSAMEDKVKNGLVAGSPYSIPTSLNMVDEASSTTVTFKIYKKVNGAWTSEPIYDSVTKEIAEGYEDFIGDNGAITPSADEISEDAVYKVVYAVVDANNYAGVFEGEGSPEMLLKVVEAPAEEPVPTKTKIRPIEIVLFCIAGVAFVGIVVLMFIKPKQPKTARVAPAKSDVAENTDEAK